MLDSSGAVSLIVLGATKRSHRISERTLHRDPDSEFEGSLCPSSSLCHLIFCPVEVERVVWDEERLLDLVERNSQEAIVSCLALHWVNDLPGSFVP